MACQPMGRPVLGPDQNGPARAGRLARRIWPATAPATPYTFRPPLRDASVSLDPVPFSMSDAYKKAKPVRLVFKGGEAASLKPKKHKKNKKPASDAPVDGDAAAAAPAEGTEGASGTGAGDDYTIDAAKRMKYEELFPVEAKKFGYDPSNAARAAARNRSVEEALDDRVRKKADRYCK
jgi:hypothetical protein